SQQGHPLRHGRNPKAPAGDQIGARRFRARHEPPGRRAEGTTMSTVGYDTSVTRKRIAPKPRRWQRQLARACRRFDAGEQYSPLLCVAMLLIVGLIVKLFPAIQTHLYN